MRLILLHGWGASGADLLPVGEALGQLLQPLVLRPLEAPDPHPAGAGARQWYDLNQPGWPQRPAAVRALGNGLTKNWPPPGPNQWWCLVFPRGRPWP